MNQSSANRYQCPKCANQNYEEGEIRTTGGFWSKVFDVQNKKFFHISCTRCGFTEFFKADSSRGGNVLDFFTG
jgi:predicted nucleic-acid-binding Zn-ribbon protein